MYAVFRLTFEASYVSETLSIITICLIVMLASPNLAGSAFDTAFTVIFSAVSSFPTVSVPSDVMAVDALF